MKPLLTLLAALSLFVLISCILGGDKTAGRRGSEVENELGVYGRLVDEGGKAVMGAKVIALPSARAGVSDTDTVTTDDKGKYAFDSLASGEYDILGDFKSGSLLVLIPGVGVDGSDSSLNLGVDTLRTPGGISGRMLAGKRGKSGILCFIPGLSRLDVSDDSGRFEIQGLPQGRYLVRYSAAGFIIAPDSGVEVKAGLVTAMPDKELEYDPELPPPAPSGLRAAYDTLNEQVSLTWDSVPVSDLEGYVIYRDAPAFLDPQIVKDGFSARTGFTDGSFGTLAHMEKRRLVYRVKSRDLQANPSISFSNPASIEVVSRSWATTTLSLLPLNAPGNSASIGDTVLFVLEYSNPTRRHSEIRWFKSGTQEVLRIRTDSSLSGRDTLMWKAGNAGMATFTAHAVDAAGSVWETRSSVSVLLDAPVANAGKDTMVSIGDRVDLRGTGGDRFGRIVKWEWDIGGQGDFRVTGADTAVNAPASPLAGYLCILRVTDDDGVSTLDTMRVVVILDAPVADAGKDTSVSLGDRVDLGGRAKDGYGQAVKWEWNIGGVSGFRETSRADTSFTVPAGTSGSILCVLRVTDDDGISSLDSIHVRVLADLPLPNAGNDTVVSIRDAIRLTGKGADGYGRIVKWEWDAGGLGVFRAGGPDTLVTAPAEEVDKYPCILRVTDDDGQTALDTVWTKVVLDPPGASLSTGEFLTVFVSDTVRISGAGSLDGFGRIAKWEFDLGGTGAFASAPGPDATVLMPGLPAAGYHCILRVTDDDGNSAVDTLSFAILERGGHEWFNVPTERVFTSRGGHAALVYKDKLWVLAGDDGALKRDVWSSENGSNWTQVTNAAGFGQRTNPACAVFAGKMWVIGGNVGTATLDDVWHSEDGVAWVRAIDNAPFGGRSWASAIAFNGKLWLIGGYPNSSVWYTENGSDWFPSESGPTRTEGPVAAILDGRLSVISADKGFWTSSDGMTWNRNSVMPAASNGTRKALAHNGIVWEFSDDLDYGDIGVHSVITRYWNDGNSSSSVYPASPPPFGRCIPIALAAFKGKMWVLGAVTDPKAILSRGNGIWISK